MKIIKSSINSNQVRVNVTQIEYSYWDKFCEVFINKCDELIDNKDLSNKKREDFKAFKESLEGILFIIDVNQTETDTQIEFSSSDLSLMYSIMQNWKSTLNKELSQLNEKLKRQINGENKRYYAIRIEKLNNIIEHNNKMISSISKYMGKL